MWRQYEETEETDGTEETEEYTMRMNLLQEYLRTYIFLIPLVVMGLSECAKMIIEWLQSGNWERRLFQHGGMPSSHSATVTSLLIVVHEKSGIESTEFAIAFILACIIWYDAVAIRGAISKQAEVLNVIQKIHKLAEKVGHSLIEVIAGIIFGAGVTIVGIWIS